MGRRGECIDRAGRETGQAGRQLGLCIAHLSRENTSAAHTVRNTRKAS